MWIREQKLKAGNGFNTAVVQLLDYLKETRLSDDGPGANELANRLQEARSALYLLCADDTVDLADALARRVWSTRPTDGRDDRRAEFRETLDLLRRFTHRLRQESVKSPWRVRHICGPHGGGPPPLAHCWVRPLPVPL